MKIPAHITRIFACAALLGLAACSGQQGPVAADAPAYVKGTKIHPKVKVGSPYEVLGKEYRPQYNPAYEEVGTASWYGPSFHGNSTANGEEYNQYAFTAAHPTLPMPSMVKVTNLNNGKEVIVRINDRGPFKTGRIIDLSKAAADKIGMIGPGVANVRVTYLKEETEAYLAKLNLPKPEEWYAAEQAMKQRQQVETAELSKPTSQAAELGGIQAAELPSPGESDKTNKPKALVEMAAFAPPGDSDTAKTNDMPPVKKEPPAYAGSAFSVIDKPRVQPPMDTKRSLIASAIASAAAEHPPDTGVYVQVASFSDRGNALKLAEKLSDLSVTEISEAIVHDRTWYRVRLGPVFNEDAATELIDQVAQLGIPDARIIPKQGFD